MKHLRSTTWVAAAVGLCIGLVLSLIVAVSVWPRPDTQTAEPTVSVTITASTTPSPVKSMKTQESDDEDNDKDDDSGGGLDLTPGIEATAEAGEVPLPDATPLVCPSPTVEVSTAEELVSALDDAAPGDSIRLADGVYSGQFVAENSGTSDKRIYLCGSAEAVLEGDEVDDGYVVHLDGAEYWALIGFTVRNGQKGVMADSTIGSYIQSLTITRIGDEAIHLRRNSIDNVVLSNTISDTGLRKPKFGEGIYVGSAKSNWCTITDCKPDRSDRNIIRKNNISGTSSESIDIKEGTVHGLVVGNTFDGSAITGADSWVDVKGTAWTIENNTGRNSPGDGFQTHQILEGWGNRNLFLENTAAVNGPGLGYALRPPLDNVLRCSNIASGAAEGLSNIDCK